MSERTLKQLVGALVVVVAVWAIATLLSGSGGGGQSATGEIAAIFSGVSEATVTEVRMSGPSGDVVLTGGSGAWTVNGLRADSGAVTRFWSVVDGLEMGGLVASNPDNHGRMGVADEGASTLEIDIDGDTRALVVGDQGPRFGTSYVRVPGQDEVYVSQGDLRSHVQRALADWQNRRIVRIDTSALAVHVLGGFFHDDVDFLPDVAVFQQCIHADDATVGDKDAGAGFVGDLFELFLHALIGQGCH